MNPDNQWATFVRNHDELTLDKLTEQERLEVFAAFGPEEKMQVYGRGLKRRLPPMLGGDARRIRMVYSLLFSLPGTPVLFYGEEIGMGEDLEADGRLAVRTPMQWDAGKNAGFSSADETQLISRLVEGDFGPSTVNVARALQDPESLLHFLADLIRRYRQCPELGWGAVEILPQPEPAVLAHRCTWETSSMVLVHNFAGKEAAVTLDVTSPHQGAGDLAGETLLDLLGGAGPQISAEGSVELQLEAYGYRWLRIPDPADTRLP